VLTNFRTTLSQKSQLNSNTYFYHFDLLEPKEINFKAGQYLMLKVPSDKGPVSRLYSIASSATEKNSFELIIEIVPNGIASNYLSNLKINDEISFQGPAGMFILRESNREKIFMVTGTGIAPVRSILKSNIKDPSFAKATEGKQKFSLFWGLKSFQDVYLLNDLKQWSNETMKQFSFKICLSREQNLDMIPESDKKFFELGHIDSYSPLLTTADYYLCGGRLVVESLKQFLLSKNIPQENIYFEKF
jgi:Na+-transporting NADH:ubiquinone oxidoreductase subunit F